MLGVWGASFFQLQAAELWTTFCDEGGNPFLRIVGAAGCNDRFLLGLELIGKTGLERLMQHAAYGAVGAGRACGECSGERGSLGLDGIAGGKTRDQSERELFLRSQPAVEQEQLLRLPHSDHARKKPGVAAIRGQAQRAIAECKPRVVCGYDDIGSLEQTQSAATGAAAHGSHNRRVNARQPLDRQMI